MSTDAKLDPLGRQLIAIELTQEELDAVWECIIRHQPKHSSPLGQALYKLQNAANGTGDRREP